jgi:hypothetical protein
MPIVGLTSRAHPSPKSTFIFIHTKAWPSSPACAHAHTLPTHSASSQTREPTIRVCGRFDLDDVGLCHAMCRCSLCLLSGSVCWCSAVLSGSSAHRPGMEWERQAVHSVDGHSLVSHLTILATSPVEIFVSLLMLHHARALRWLPSARHAHCVVTEEEGVTVPSHRNSAAHVDSGPWAREGGRASSQPASFSPALIFVCSLSLLLCYVSWFADAVNAVPCVCICVCVCVCAQMRMLLRWHCRRLRVPTVTPLTSRYGEDEHALHPSCPCSSSPSP